MIRRHAKVPEAGVPLTATPDASESEERYRAIFEQVPVGVVHSSMEGRLLDVNARFCDISGYSRDEALALDVRELTHRDDIEASLAERARMIAGKTSAHRRELRLIRKDGAEVWTHVSTSLIRGSDGQPAHFLSLVHDISTQKRAEEELRESELRFRQVTETIREVFWLTDPAKKELFYVSPAYETIWGRSAQALLTSPRDWALGAAVRAPRLDPCCALTGDESRAACHPPGGSERVGCR